MEKWILITIGIVLAAFAGLFFSIRSTSEATAPIDGISCLPNGHQNLAQHIHPELMIIENGVQQIIPANIGVSQQCMRWTHTHDSTGVIHLETPEKRNLTLGQFISVWKADRETTILDGKSVVNVTVDDELFSQDYKTIVLKDKQKIVITIGNSTP